MSFETRMLALDSDITDLETAAPFVLTQDFPPNQINWEDAWVAAGNTLPIPTIQELYWKDDFALRGEYKTLPDQFSLLARSQSTGFQIRDIAGWEDDDHLIVFVVRDDNATGVPAGTCRMYMDGTLEQMTFTSFTPTGLLGYDRVNNNLWYYEGLVIKRIKTTNSVITTVATVVGGGLPEWRFFVILADGSGDVYYGARIGADAQRSLYFYDLSVPSNTNVRGTINPGGGAVNADRPVAATLNYVFLSTVHTRSAFDGNKVQQLRRSDHTWQIQVNHGTFSNEVRVLVNKTNYSANTIELVVGHLTTIYRVEDWNFTTLWNAATQTATTTPNQPHNTMLQILRQNINDHNLAYHMDTRLYYDPAFVADGGSEVHFNSIGALVLNPTGDKYLVHDLGWHTWTVSDAPDIYLFGDTTHKIYRVSDWSQFDDDVIIFERTVSDGTSRQLDLSPIPADYGMIEVIYECYAPSVGTGSSFTTILNGTGLNTGGGYLCSDSPVALFNTSVPSFGVFFSEFTTNASIAHIFLMRRQLSANYEIAALPRVSVRTQHNISAGGIAIHAYLEGSMVFASSSNELIYLPDISGNRVVVRAWRTVPRVKPNGAEYDPSMA